MTNGFKLLTAPPAVSDALTVVMLIAVIGVAWLTYHVIEKPAREWSRARADQWWAQQPVAHHPAAVQE